jgi:tellurite resistance protein TehA-like permease
MATGILSIGASMLGVHAVGIGLLYLNIGAYVVLAILFVLRIAWFAPNVFNDMIDHRRAPGFFTVVAATCILGNQFLLIVNSLTAAIISWGIALLLWIGLTYTVFVALTVKQQKPTLDEGITGAWLLAIVATQSVALLSALIATHWQQPYRLELNFLAFSLWLWSGMFYIWMISLIFYRYTFFGFSPGDLSPPYWINMGAMAISVLVGARLVENTDAAPFLLSVLPFLKGFTVFYWATGTWWIPMLLLLGVWRYVYQRFPFEYDPLYWGAVFPFGMYTACTWQMDRAMEFGFLSGLPRISFYIALAAWVITFIGMLRMLLRGVLHRA